MEQISSLSQVSDFPEEQLLVAVFPGVPTAAELFLLPHKNQSEGKKKSEEELEQVWPSATRILTSQFVVIQRHCSLSIKTVSATVFSNVKRHAVCVLQVSDIIVSALNQNLVEFELKPGLRVIVYNTQLTLGKKPLLYLLSVLPLSY